MFRNICSCLASSLRIVPNGISFKNLKVDGVFGVFGVCGDTGEVLHDLPVRILKLNPNAQPGTSGGVEFPQGNPVFVLNLSPLEQGGLEGVFVRGVVVTTVVNLEGDDPEILLFDSTSGSGSEVPEEMVNEVTARVLEVLPAVSVTMIVQLEYVPTARAVSVIVFDPDEALVVTLLHDPPYEIVPASEVVKV